MVSGCEQCHSVGKPNADGTHRHLHRLPHPAHRSVAIARMPSTCGQCHMGPDHSQIEIYEESKHGVMFAAQEKLLNLAAAPKALTTRDMFVPTCATCHMSGINGLAVTHDPSERLSYFLCRRHHREAAELRAGAGQDEAGVPQCHTQPLIDRVYAQAETGRARTPTSRSRRQGASSTACARTAC